ncbi:L,D-transpeptidase [Tardiphaga sp. P9-11]|jgi:lipoprotein-anchoring transpeptidase ErfK/SrfK|uniref:L,D-transpeptidase n=1 Tax=Tardiphaga sp. P9-11 TaxID=2024614 RepID=UPI0011F37B8F|nr:L,D-transpeptidase [Tardiphaga sp. P9-11]KAA0073702.1 L,D-transpeptidase [Tardiphaga sp. P9-11]
MSQASSGNRKLSPRLTSALVVTAALIVAPPFVSSASAQVMNYAPAAQSAFPPDEDVMAAPRVRENMDVALPERLRRAEVSYMTREAPGTVIIDTGNTQLYYVLGNNRAIRYGVGVGREGFTWSGTQTVTRKAEWPDWHPPQEMIARQPYLPRFMAGGPGNPLGARAMYLGSSAYRIHGTNDPSTIGKFVSSGCIRLTNEDVQDLFSRVSVGTKVVVLPKSVAPRYEARTAPAPRSVTSISVRPAGAQQAPGRQAMNLSASSLY